MPDIIGIGKSGSTLLVEVVSKSQTYEQMAMKLALICAENPNCLPLIISWAGNIGRWLI